MKNNWEKRICVSLTGKKKSDWQGKLNKINDLGLSEVALFLEYYQKAEREEIYNALEDSSVNYIPLVHLRNDMSREEIEYLGDTYKSKFFTIHEDSFGVLEKWHGYYRRLYLELNFDDYVAQNVKVKNIGGFCVDLAHFKAAEEMWSEEFEYTIKERKHEDMFGCNHLSGYSPTENRDLHEPKSIKDFEYLRSLPDFVFGEVIAIEVDKSIKEQLEFKEGIIKILEK